MVASLAGALGRQRNQEIAVASNKIQSLIHQSGLRINITRYNLSQHLITLSQSYRLSKYSSEELSGKRIAANLGVFLHWLGY